MRLGRYELANSDLGFDESESKNEWISVWKEEQHVESRGKERRANEVGSVCVFVEALDRVPLPRGVQN